MNRTPLSTVLRQVRGFAGAASDGQLLEQFKSRQDEAAFAALLARHGPMILGLCRRLLRDPHDAEDAFQATFLVLVCRAGAVCKRESVGSWLYGVAYRIALRAKERAGRFEACEKLDELPDARREESADVLARRELAAALDEELNRLPEKYRAPLVLCCLEGATGHEAAERMGWSFGTLRRRLERGRELLRVRLTRRGVLPAAAFAVAGLTEGVAPAAVPIQLTAVTLKAAVLMAAGKVVATGAISVQAAALTKGVLKAFLLAKVKAITAVVLLVGVVGAGAGWSICQLPVGRAGGVSPLLKTTNNDRVSQQGADAPRSPASAKKTITVRVLDSAGKPLAGADVAIIGLGRSKPRIRGMGVDFDNLGQGRAGDDGRFSFALPDGTQAKSLVSVCVLARGTGHGLGFQGFDPAAAPAALDVRLSREQPLRVRLVSLQGVPAGGVRVRVTEVQARTLNPDLRWTWAGRHRRNLPKDLPLWPADVVTDEQGRCTLRGLSADAVPHVAVEGERFARQSFEVKPNDNDRAKEFALALEPARFLEGRVTYGDTGKPAANVRVHVQARKDALMLPGNAEPVECRSDAAGRFRANLQAGKYIDVAAYPAAGEPYLPIHKAVEWPKAGLVKQGVDLALFRGVPVRGTITEKPSGKPVAGASVTFRWRQAGNPFFRREVGTGFLGGRERLGISDADGKFTIVVPPGPGHLLVKGDTPDFLHAEITAHELSSPDVRPNRRNYPDGLAALDTKPGDGPRDVAITLRRGITRTGMVIGPDGRPVREAVLYCRSYIPYGFDRNGTYGLEIKNGRFELPGCDPDKSSEVFVFSKKARLGAVAQLDGKPDQPHTIRLQPCGTAKVRFVDEEGKPVVRLWPLVDILITPGVFFANNFDVKGVEAETANMMNLASDIYNELRSDEQGRATLPCLIPGATYVLLAQGLGRGTTDLKKTFKVEPGQTIDLGDLRWPSRP